MKTKLEDRSRKIESGRIAQPRANRDHALEKLDDKQKNEKNRPYEAAVTPPTLADYSPRRMSKQPTQERL